MHFTPMEPSRAPLSIDVRHEIFWRKFSWEVSEHGKHTVWSFERLGTSNMHLVGAHRRIRRPAGCMTTDGRGARVVVGSAPTVDSTERCRRSIHTR